MTDFSHIERRIDDMERGGSSTMTVDISEYRALLDVARATETLLFIEANHGNKADDIALATRKVEAALSKLKELK